MKLLERLMVVVVAGMIPYQSVVYAADESPMEEGIREYTAGKYSDALGHLGGALNSEFNNAKLHYYMGSCYMKLRQKDAAVREFRIAYALEPTGTPGKYAKQALDSLDVDKSQPGTAGGGDIFTKGLKDQKALSKAIADYEKQRDGVNILNPSTFGGFLPPPLTQSVYPPTTAGSGSAGGYIPGTGGLGNHPFNGPPSSYPGVGPGQNGYPGQQSGYPGQQNGYPAQNGYPGLQNGYPGLQNGYPGQENGFPTGFPNQ